MWVTNCFWWIKVWRSSSHSKLISIWTLEGASTSATVTCKDLYKLDFLNKLTHTWAFAFSPVLIVNILFDKSHKLKKLPNFNGELMAICCNRKAHYPCLLVCVELCYAVFYAVATDGWQLKLSEICIELERLLESLTAREAKVQIVHCSLSQNRPPSPGCI